MRRLKDKLIRLLGGYTEQEVRHYREMWISAEERLWRANMAMCKMAVDKKKRRSRRYAE